MVLKCEASGPNTGADAFSRRLRQCGLAHTVGGLEPHQGLGQLRMLPGEADEMTMSDADLLGGIVDRRLPLAQGLQLFRQGTCEQRGEQILHRLEVVTSR